MKNKIFTLLFIFTFIVSCSHNVKKSELNKAYEVEVVQAEGTAPIVNSDIESAKKASLNDAMKNALALVIGVYVSGDTFVSKSVLIDDSITSKSEGYIEKYKVLKEYKDGEFYKTKIEAHVRKEDLSAKLKNLETEVERIGSPVVFMNILENKGENEQISVAANQLISKLREDGFRISQSTESADIIISGKASSSFNTKEGLGGFVSYSAVLSVELSNSAGEIIGAINESAGGIGVNEEAAYKESLSNVAKKSYEKIKNSIFSYYKEKRIISFRVENAKNINQINELIKYFRNIPIIKNSVLKSFNGENALIEILMHKGDSSQLIPIISKNEKFEILKTKPFEINVKLK